MRLHFVVTCVAGAVSLVSIGSRAEPYNTTIVSARSPSAAPSELSAEKHMSSHNLDEEEERVFTTAEVELALHPQKWDESMSTFLSQDMKAVDLFKLLGLYKALDDPVNNILVSFKLAYLEKFMELYNKKNGNNPATLAETLSNFLDGNKEFYTKLLKLNGETAPAQLKSLREKATPADVFFTMHPHMARHKTALKFMKLQKWINYAEAYDTVYNDHALIKCLISLGYADFILADMVIASKTKLKAGYNKQRVYKALAKFWLAEELEPEKVFHLLSLDNIEANPDIFKGPRIQKWMDYVDEFDAKTKKPKSYLSRLELLMKPAFSKKDLMDVLRKRSTLPTIRRISKNHRKQRKKEREELIKEADLGKADKHLDAESSLQGMKRKRNAEELTSPTDI